MSREMSTNTCASRRPSSTTSESSGSASSSHDGSSSSASSSSASFANLRIPIIRPYPRREVDLRRPARLTNQPHSQTVIDLTQEPSSPPDQFVLPPERSPDPLLRRPPSIPQPPRIRSPPQRTEPLYIDLSDTEEPQARRPASPEVQILSSRTRSRSLSVNNRRNIPGRRGTSPARHRNPPQLHRPHLPGFAELDFSTRVARARDELVGWEGFAGSEHFNIPNMLDFRAVGFDLDHPHHQEPQPRLPTYEAPPPPKPGFTRSPNEGDYLACAECEAELGVGEEEPRKQVWVNKTCGHVG